MTEVNGHGRARAEEHLHDNGGDKATENEPDSNNAADDQGGWSELGGHADGNRTGAHGGGDAGQERIADQIYDGETDGPSEDGQGLLEIPNGEPLGAVKGEEAERNGQKQIAETLHDILHDHHGELDHSADPDQEPADAILDGLHDRVADIEPIDSGIGGLDQLHERRAGAVEAAGEFLADGNSYVPEFVPDGVEPKRERGEQAANHEVGHDGAQQLADAGAAATRADNDGGGHYEEADEAQLLVQGFDHRLESGN